jgi:TolB-like protein/Flp pilus assembly protein TadD
MAINGGGEKASGSTPEVFISYASQDATLAEAIVEALERQGLKCWIAPRDVTAGAPYAGQIIHAIDAAKASVLILSRDAAASPHVLREVERTTSKRHSIVALRIDQAPLPADFEYFLNASHWLDTSADSIWRVLPKLVAAVQFALQTPAGTPAGAPTSHASAPAVSTRPLKKMAMIVVSLIGLSLVGFVADRLWLSHRRAVQPPASALGPAAPASGPTPAAPTIPEKSVAVLPFVDMSEKKDQEYFSDGLSEELIDMLAKVPDLRVPARTSSFYFKGKQTTIAEIAKALGVAQVLEGSVRKSGNNLRVTAQLVRADNGYHVWSDTYDRKFDDIFKIQDEIAAAVVTELKASLLKGSSPRADIPQNLEAHALFLRARYFQVRDTRDDLAKAIRFLEQAVRLNPDAAPYWAQLSRAYAQDNGNPAVPWKILHDKAQQAAVKALDLDPNLPEAHIARAKTALVFDLDFPTAVAEIEQARLLDPTHIDVVAWSAVRAYVLGYGDDALRFSRQATMLDPLSTNAYNQASLICFLLGRYAEAEAASREALNLNPDTENAHSTIGLSMLMRGANPATALAEIANESDAETRTFTLALANQILGRQAVAEEWLAAHKSSAARTDQYNIAQLRAVRGESDQAFAALERAFVLHDSSLEQVKMDPFLKSLRPDSRYKLFLRKLKLPE